MYNEDEIEDSLEFCRQIQFYYDAEKKKTDKEDDAKIHQEHTRKSAHTLDELSMTDITTWNGKNRSGNGVMHFVNNLFVLAVCVLIAYFIASVVTHYVAHQTSVEGESMEPSLSDGDSIIIQKVSYYLGEPERFDVVVFPVNNDDIDPKGNTYYVKRVIGLPNETVQIIGGKVYINNQELKGDNYCLSKILNPGNASEPIVLGDNEYFVLGDNRNMSTDSRSDYVGLIQRKDIVGEVLACVWPFSHMGLIPQ